MTADPHPVAQLLARMTAELAGLIDEAAPSFARIAVSVHYPRNPDYPYDGDPSYPVIHRREMEWRGGECHLIRSVTEERPC